MSFQDSSLNELCQTFSLPEQRTDKAPSLFKMLQSLGIRTGDRITVVGWKYLMPEEWDDPQTLLFCRRIRWSPPITVPSLRGKRRCASACGAEELHQAVVGAFEDSPYRSSLNPGHLTSYEEWMHSPIGPASHERIQSGMIVQCDRDALSIPRHVVTHAAASGAHAGELGARAWRSAAATVRRRWIPAAFLAGSRLCLRCDPLSLEKP